MNENKKSITIFLGQLIALAFFFILCIFVLHDGTGITNKRVQRYELDTNWEVMTEGKNVYYDKLPVSIKTSDDNTIWISRKIEEVTSDNNAIGMFSFQKEVHAYLDDEEVLVFENTSKAKSKMPGNSWLFIQLQPEDVGKTLTIQLHQCYGKGQVIMPVLYAGTVDGITNSYLKSKLPLICFSAVGMAVGVVLVILWLLVGENLMLSEGLPWLGLFAIVRGMWSLLEANIYSFYVNHLLLWVWLSYICLKLTIVPFALFDNITFHNGKSKFLKVIAGIGLVDTAVTTVLQLFGIADFADTVAITNLLILVLAIYIVVSGIKTVYRNSKDKMDADTDEKRVTYIVHTIFMFVLVITTLIDVYRFYFTNTPDIARFSRVGYFIYVIAVMLALLWDFARLANIGRKAEYIREEASVDSMTKLYNRVAFERSVDLYVGKKCEHKGIIMFDLNNLKLYNDKLGHDMGDYYIKICSEVIRDLYGKYGNIYRIGGDEFCGIVEKMSPEEFESVKNEMARRINTLRIPGFEIKMEIAAGYCRYESSKDHSLRDTMHRADEKMYENKALLKKKL